MFCLRSSCKYDVAMIRATVVIPILVFLTGCGGASRTYEVNLRNESMQPVTVWLTKSGPPYEASWKPPEQLALEQPGSDKLLGGVIIPAGSAGSTGSVSGRFPADTDAILRVYLGEYSISGLLAISRGSPNRIDVVLKPGVNNLSVRDRGGRTVVEPTSQQPVIKK